MNISQTSSLMLHNKDSLKPDKLLKMNVNLTLKRSSLKIFRVFIFHSGFDVVFGTYIEAQLNSNSH